jgi:hypothetical protein
MHLKPACRKSRAKLRHKGFSLLFTPAVHKTIVSISTPWKVRMRPCHPEIKCIVHEADHTPLRGTACSLNDWPAGGHPSHDPDVLVKLPSLPSFGPSACRGG